MVEKSRSPFVTYLPHVGLILMGIAAWFSVVSDVRTNTDTAKWMQIAQEDHEEEDLRSSRQKWDDIKSNRDQLNEMKTQTSILRTRQEIQTQDIGEMKQDIKSILRAVKR